MRIESSTAQAAHAAQLSTTGQDIAAPALTSTATGARPVQAKGVNGVEAAWFRPPTLPQPWSPVSGRWRPPSFQDRIMSIMLMLFQQLLQLLNRLQQRSGDRFMRLGSSAGGPAVTGTPVDAKEAKPQDGPGGFVFKPVSDSDGKLVVLLPKDKTDKVESLTIRDQSGRTLEKGRFADVANGGREHFRFSKPGAGFGSNVLVEVKMKDGSVEHYKIADPSKRYD